MSDQTVNYARPRATAPILLGAAGAILGTMVAPVKRGYRKVDDILVDEFKFNKVAENFEKVKAGLEDGSDLAKSFGKLNDAKTTLASLGDDAMAKAAKIKEFLAKDGLLEGFKPKKDLKGIVPRAKGWWGVGLALVGLFIGRIISVNKANKKNMELIQQAQQNQQV